MQKFEPAGGSLYSRPLKTRNRGVYGLGLNFQSSCQVLLGLSILTRESEAQVLTFSSPKNPSRPPHRKSRRNAPCWPTDGPCCVSDARVGNETKAVKRRAYGPNLARSPGPKLVPLRSAIRLTHK
jgi:hypothetical protein